MGGVAVSSSKFAIRGVVEGFYGVYYTFPEREDLIRFMGDLGFNTYVYGPKDDREHRMRWREPYPQETIERFAHTVQVARESGVTFVYALSTGVSICYSSDQDFARIQDKFSALMGAGVRDFSLFLDDISHEFAHEEDRRAYTSYAQAHADLCNRTLRWLRSVNPDCTLSMCPTDYCGVEPFGGYIYELGRSLDPQIDIFYTGPQVCSTEITVEHTTTFGRAAGRLPIIWDNYPVNDSGMRSELHLGPVKGRSADLFMGCKGIVSNTMIQAEASKIALLTFADYFADPAGYQPEVSWEQAIRRVAGDASAKHVQRLAETCRFSCLESQAAPRLAQMVEQLLSSRQRGAVVEGDRAARELAGYLEELDEACYHITYRMSNLALRNNLLPWVEVLEHWVSAGQNALVALERLDHGEGCERSLQLMNDALEEIRRHPKQITGGALKPLVDYCIQLAKESS
jgi:hyaluronoglucosaminidase